MSNSDLNKAKEARENHTDVVNDESSYSCGTSKEDGTKSSAFESTTYPSIGAEESKKVNRWRLILVFVLFFTAAAMCTGTYIFVQNEANQEYILSFTLFANSMEEQMGHHVSNLQEGLRNLGDTLTASANVEDQQEFPFVKVQHWETHGEHARARSKMEAIAYAPLVAASNKTEWELFAVENQDWIQTSRATYLDHLPVNMAEPVYIRGRVPPFIYKREEGNSFFTDPADEDHDSDHVYAPIWYLSPPPFNPAIVNFDVLSDTAYQVVLQEAIQSHAAAFSPVMNVETFSSLQVSDADHVAYHEQYTGDLSLSKAGGTLRYDLPHSLYAQPVFATPDNTEKDVVGVIWGAIAWDAFLADLLPNGVEGVILVLHSTCSEDNTYTYELNGPVPRYLGPGDLHDPFYNSMVREIPFDNDYHEDKETVSDTNTTVPSCHYSMQVYPSKVFEDDYASNITIIATATVAATFCIVALIFLIYDTLVRSRNDKITAVATESNAMVNSLFPSNVRERLMEATNNSAGNNNKGNATKMLESAGQIQRNVKPIADLFTDCTVLFADVVGFTAWSSMREPSQVFTLLETLYAKFDEVARRRKVFKVETVGDCYVAATGVPYPRKDHCLIMARFARDCVRAFKQTVKDLEVELGPDTGELAVRVGLHSGPVTAGVLRGDRARFQLFGDTMNTAARIESNGRKNMIHCSQETANLLVAAGKENWVVKREDIIVAKGKGQMQTFWIHVKDGGGSSFSGDSDNNSTVLDDKGGKLPDNGINEASKQKVTGKMDRLVDWNCDVLCRLLKQVVASRVAAGQTHQTSDKAVDEKCVLKTGEQGKTVIDEVANIIKLPTFDARIAAARQKDDASVELPSGVEEQMRHFVMMVCSMYKDNPFHNFEHASHVTMSITKLLSRIVAPSVSFEGENKKTPLGEDASSMHDHTYGINSDPLTQFSVVFAGLIHDIDHPGVPNAQLVKEGLPLADMYKGKSVAEQNSVDLAWDLLMDGQYNQLRACIYSNETELSRFRQLVVNAVMATDIVDKNLKALRNARWEKAFSGEHIDEDKEEEVNRKATIVIEHLIQASDVAHTMQHWHIYRKWNERFFLECYKAYKDGRSQSDPTVFWYKGEIGFFDFYIIPLAKKLKDCGVFGVASDEYLTYAMKNREEWVARGEEVVEEMIRKAHDVFGGE